MASERSVAHDFCLLMIERGQVDLSKTRDIIWLLKTAKYCNSVPGLPTYRKGALQLFVYLIESVAIGDWLTNQDALIAVEKLATERSKQLTAERDDARGKLRNIGRKAFWAAKSGGGS